MLIARSYKMLKVWFLVSMFFTSEWLLMLDLSEAGTPYTGSPYVDIYTHPQSHHFIVIFHHLIIIFHHDIILANWIIMVFPGWLASLQWELIVQVMTMKTTTTVLCWWHWTKMTKTGLFGNFSQHGGGGLPNSQNFSYPNHSCKKKPLKHLKITQKDSTWPKKQ